MKQRVEVIWKSFFITLLIFGFAVLFNHFIDFVRIDVINDVISDHELDRDAYLAQQDFIEAFSDYGCSPLKSRLDGLKEEIRFVGTELSTYSRFSLFMKKDFDYLKRKYFLLEFEFLSLVQKINDMCGNPYLPVLFFYEIDDGKSEMQGFILEDVAKNFEDDVIVLSIDKDYVDEPLVKMVVDMFNISEAPSIILDGKKYEGLISSETLNSTFTHLLSPADPYGKNQDLDYTVNAVGVNVSDLIVAYSDLLKNISDHFSRGDLLFLLGRLQENDSLICSSLQEFDKVGSDNLEESALAFESIASIDCGRNKAAFYNLAADKWEKVGKFWRADLMRVLAEGDRPRLKFDVYEVYPSISKGNFSEVTLGKSVIYVNKFSNIISQADRVSRDWLMGFVFNPFSDEILNIFSEVKSWKKEDLMIDIGWHEGGRIRDMLKVGASNSVAVGTVVAFDDGRWFAPDENGVFRFEIPKDKVMYPTTRFLRDDLAVIIDTHGVNMLVDQAISKNASLVVGCGDHPAKASAAKYLSDRGIDVISFPNKFFYLLLGHNSSVLGSPPFEFYMDQLRFGGRPITLTKDDKIVVSNSSNEEYALWYYQSPAQYFSVLEDFIDLDIEYFMLRDFEDQLDLVEFARKNDAHVIATRIYNKYDYGAAKEWLEEDKKNKAILFHSSPYPYGVLLFEEFPEQTSFGDVNPIFR